MYFFLKTDRYNQKKHGFTVPAIMFKCYIYTIFISADIIVIISTSITVFIAK